MIGEVYPLAYERLQAALEARHSLAEAWSGLLGRGVFDTTVVLDPVGTGRIIVTADWPRGAREELTRHLAECVGHMWACLDSLVAESVAMLSAIRRPTAPEAPRFFPVADSAESLDALLAQSCMDGVLARQHAMVVDCQPFWPTDADPRIQIFRDGLRLLTDWANALADGSLAGAWVTPVKPRVRVDPPARVREVVPLGPGEVIDARDVATFAVDGRASAVQALAGSYVDLAFPAGLRPHAADDTLGRQVTLAVEVVTRFAVSFAWLAREASVIPRLAAPDLAGPWTDAAASARRWSHHELASVAACDGGVGVVADATDRTLTLLVSTDRGVFERQIPAATTLNPHAEPGPAAERAVQSAAATWGLPDFVIPPTVTRTGSGVREISDGLIVCGDRGAVVQVKTRTAAAASRDREARWLTKQITAAASQVDGTVRRLSAEAITMTNGRGRKIVIDGAAITWTGVIIIDHDAPPPEYRPAQPTARTPMVILLRRDWEFLFHQLRSTRAALDYLARVEDEAAPLGEESIRYYQLAASDARAEPTPMPAALALGGTPASVPLLPAAPAGTDDGQAHGLLRIMCEDIANCPIEPTIGEDARVRVLGAIDALPVGYRTDLGRLLLDALHTASHIEPDTRSWQFRTYRSATSEQLAFGVCSTFDDLTRDAFRSWLLLRHHERGIAGGDLDSLTSIAVLLTPRPDGLREWDTTMLVITGDPELTPNELHASRQLWNTST